MLVVVERLIVVAAGARVPLYKDRVRGVDHDLPDVVVLGRNHQVSGCGSGGRATCVPVAKGNNAA